MSNLSANTMGWDMVFAITVSEANKAIVAQDSSPKTFSADSGEQDIKVDGNFDHWELSIKGSAHSVIMRLPVTTAKLTRPRDDARGYDAISISVNNLFAEVEVELEYIATDELAKLNKKGKRHHLKVRNIREDGRQVAHVTSVQKSSGVFSDPSIPIIVSGALETWLQTNLAKFEHIFATLDLHIDPSKPAYKWMIPSDLDYAFAPAGDPEDAVLGVLSMTNSRVADGKVPEVSTGVIPNGQKSAVVIGFHTLMQDLLIPGMPRVFKNTKPEEYIIDKDLLGMSLSKPVKLDAVNHDGKTYHPVMEEFTLRFEVDRMSMSSTTAVEITPGITSYTQVTSEFQLVVGKNDKGEQTLGFHVIKKGTPHNWHEESTALKATGDILIAITAIAGIVLAVFTLGASAIVALTIIAVVAGLGAATINIIGKVGEDDAPTITDLISTAVNPITWPNGTGFTITGSNMDNALQMIGDFTAAN